MGDAGVYSAITLLAFINFLSFSIFFDYSQLVLFVIGLIFFAPAVIQLRYKSRKKSIKFLMRFSLGSSIYYLLLFIFRFDELTLQLATFAIFITTAIIYASFNSRKHLVECVNCVYSENYHTCLIRYQNVLAIKGIEKVRDFYKEVDKMLLIQEMRKKDAS